MAAVGGYLRPLTEEDKKTMREVNKIPKQEKDFNRKVESFTKECRDNQVPYCETCMRMAFKQRKDQIKSLLERASENRNIELTDKDLDLNTINLEDYIGEHLIYLKDTTLKEQTWSQGSKVTIPITFKDYRCKQGHNFSMRIEKPEETKIKVK